MFKIEAIIRNHLLEPVRTALEDIDVVGITALDCRGAGRQAEVTHQFRGSSYSHGMTPRVLIIVVVSADQLNDAVDTIQKVACTSEVGDGKIMVTALTEVVRIRTNERGDLALK